MILQTNIIPIVSPKFIVNYTAENSEIRLQKQVLNKDFALAKELTHNLVKYKDVV